MRQVDWVVVHTAGAYDLKNHKVVYQSIETIRDYHIRHNGWRDIGYHWVIEEDGTCMPGRPEDDIGAHAEGFNDHSIGICVTGDGDYAAFLPSQLATLIRKCAQICGERRLPGIRVIGHRETGQYGGPPVYKTCPGKLIDMNEIRRLVGDRLETS